MIAFESLIDLPCMMTGIWSRFGVHLFQGALTIAEMDHAEELSLAWRRKNPGPSVELSIIFPGDAKWTSEERARMARLIKRWEHQRVGAATVVLAEGLIGAMHRSVLTGLLMISPPPHPSKVFGSLKQAVAWLAPYVQSICGPGARAEEIVLSVEDFCKKFQTSRAEPAILAKKVALRSR